MKIKEIFDKPFKGLRIENNSDNKLDAYLIDTKDVENCVIRINKSELKTINMEVSPKYFLKEGDIIIATVPSSTTAHVGYCSIISDEDKCIIKKNFIILRNCNEKYNAEFVAEYLELFGVVEAYNKKNQNKSEKEALTTIDIENIEIPNIPIDKQNKLVEVFDPMNERVDLFNRIISNENRIKKYLISEMIESEK